MNFFKEKSYEDLLAEHVKFREKITKDQLRVWGMLVLIEIFFLILSMMKGTGGLFFQVAILIVPITLLSCYIVAYIGANANLLCYVVLILNFGFLNQMFTEDKEGTLTGTLVKLAFAFIVALVMGFLYNRFSSWLNITAMIPVIMIVQILLCLSLIIFGTYIGDEQGATIALNLGFVSFQPLTVVMFLYVFVMAIIYDEKDGHTRKIAGIQPEVITIIYTAIIALFMVMCKELGTLVIILMTGFVMMLIYSENRKLVWISGGVGLLGASAMAFIVEVFHNKVSIIRKVYDRFYYWISPEMDAQGKGFQQLMVRKALAIGQTAGPETERYFNVVNIPERDTDMIVANMVLTVGVVLTMVMIFVLALMMLQMYRISRKADSKLGMGITILFSVHSLLHIACNTGWAPIIGIQLPLVSKGFTSMTMSLVMVAVMLIISKNKERNYDDEEVLNGKVKAVFQKLKRKVSKNS